MPGNAQTLDIIVEQPLALLTGPDDILKDIQKICGQQSQIRVFQIPC